MSFFRDFFPGKEFIFIAEIGINHNGSINNAGNMIKEAHRAGADAVKFQTFIPENMNSAYTSSLLNCGMEKEPDSKERDFFRQFVFTEEEYADLMSMALQLDLVFFSSPFDIESVELLEKIGVKLYKIASSEITNHILLKKIAGTKKPVIMSTGISDENEIAMAIRLLKDNGTPDIVLMHCVSLYPLPPGSANLNRILSLKKRFELEVGFSDHSGNNKVCETAAALGARIFEKHLKPDHGFDCPDKDVSATPEEFSDLVELVKFIDILKGTGEINYNDSEKEVARSARRSLFARKAIPKGKRLSMDDIIPKRPGIGIPVYKLDDIIGKTANTDIKEDYLLKFEYFT